MSAFTGTAKNPAQNPSKPSSTAELTSPCGQTPKTSPVHAIPTDLREQILQHVYAEGLLRRRGRHFIDGQAGEPARGRKSQQRVARIHFAPVKPFSHGRPRHGAHDDGEECAELDHAIAPREALF